MDIKLFRQILKEFEKSTIHKLEIGEKDFTIKMEKKPEGQIVTNTLSHTPIQKVVTSEVVEPEKQKSHFEIVESPLVGTFYNSPSPDSAPFIKVNQSVNEGDVLCIVEAMKVMNEIRSPYSGIVKKIHIENESMVEYGQCLIEIEAN